MTEREIIEKVNGMCIQSISPEKFEMWEKVKKGLELSRPNLSPIEWEFIEWTEQKESSALIKGVDKNGIEYEGTGLIVEGQVEEVYEFEQITATPSITT